MVGEVLHGVHGEVDDAGQVAGVDLLSQLTLGQVVQAGGGCHLDTQGLGVVLHGRQDQLWPDMVSLVINV